MAALNSGNLPCPSAPVLPQEITTVSSGTSFILRSTQSLSGIQPKRAMGEGSCWREDRAEQGSQPLGTGSRWQLQRKQTSLLCRRPPTQSHLQEVVYKTAFTFQAGVNTRCHLQHWSHSKSNGFSLLKGHREEQGRPRMGRAAGAKVCPAF